MQNELLLSIDKLHSTELGIFRIRRNLSLNREHAGDVVVWCKEQILLPAAIITRQGKNWYIEIKNSKITVNAHSYTIITAHKIKTPNS